MRIKIRSLQGEEYNVNVEADQLVVNIKQLVSEQIDVPVERQKLVYKGRTLLDSSCIKEYNLEEDCKLNLLILKVTPTVPSVSLLAPHTRRSTTDQSNQATTSNDNHTRNAKRDEKSDFQKLIELKLSAHFEPSVVDKIIMALNEEIKDDIKCSSLDDLERLAKQKLNIGIDATDNKIRI